MLAKRELAPRMHGRTASAFHSLLLSAAKRVNFYSGEKPMFNHKIWTDTTRTGLVYFTVGMLIDVWVTVWYFAFAGPSDQPMSNNTWFWLAGFFLTGVTLMFIGIVQGVIHRSAQKAEVQISAKSAEEGGNAAPSPAAVAAQPMLVSPAPIMMPPPVPMPGIAPTTAPPAMPAGAR
jgi:hypothetical protein